MQAVSLSDVIFFHALWRALSRGSHTPARPGLPDELIIHITHYARLLVSASGTDAVSSHKVEIRSSDANISTERWFSTLPFTHEMLFQVAQAQLTTISRHQGCAMTYPESGCWSWFELCIYPACAPDGDEPKTSRDGRVLVWRSHCNPNSESSVHQIHPSREGGAVHVGEKFGPEHELWDELEEGDVIGVRACAQFSGWCNFASKGVLVFRKFFEPSIAV